jgi:S1-C subfamily serine protease
VSAKGRNINILRDKAPIESFIQTDAAVNPGNSGGALVTLNGELVGINTAIASPTGAYAGYSFAVPVNIVKKVVEDLITYGTVQRAFLGVMIRDVNADLAREEGLEVNSGIFLDSLMGESAARDAGMKHGDVITRVDGQAVQSVPELQEIIARKRPGDEVDVTAIRGGKEKSFTINLKNRKGNTEIVKKPKREISTALGAEFEALDKKTKKKLELENGVKVKRLLPGTIRRQTTMAEGFIITKVNGQAVSTLNELTDAIEKAEEGVTLEGVYPDRVGKYFYAFNKKR